jgi:hypothetical protein
LLPQTAASQLGVQSTGQKKVGEARVCKWSGATYGVSVGIFDNLGIDRSVAGQVSKPITINDGAHRATQDRSAGGVCAVSMEVTRSSSVDVEASVDSGNTDQGCQLVELAARAVEPNLPKN